MSATEQNYQGLEGRDHNPQQPDGALRGRKPRQGKFGPRAKSGGSRHQEGERQDRRQEHASHDEPREGRGRRGGSFNHRGKRPGGEAFGRGEQRDHGERGPRSARDERGFSRNERSYSHKDRRDHRDEGARFERARDREAHDRDARDADFEDRFDRRERFAPKREHFVKDKGDFSRSAEDDGGKRDRFASERHDRPARGSCTAAMIVRIAKGLTSAVTAMKAARTCSPVPASANVSRQGPGNAGKAMGTTGRSAALARKPVRKPAGDAARTHEARGLVITRTSSRASVTSAGKTAKGPATIAGRTARTQGKPRRDPRRSQAGPQETRPCVHPPPRRKREPP